jgi:hypothetical protein
MYFLKILILFQACSSASNPIIDLMIHQFPDSTNPHLTDSPIPQLPPSSPNQHHPVILLVILGFKFGFGVN